ncbi:cytochrome P450 [Streptomyces sp. NPDC048717]|uniref:cytochrome P450 n=1 Tax=Streptomyces sp. NPDC048717 TaxID=3154928 RepID=UPI0034270EFB
MSERQTGGVPDEVPGGTPGDGTEDMPGGAAEATPSGRPDGGPGRSTLGHRNDRAPWRDLWARLPTMAPAARPAERALRPGARRVPPSPLAPGAARDPYRTYRVLREEFPLTHDPLLRAWVLSRYADVAGALTDSRFTHGHRPGDPPCAQTHTDVDEAELRAVAERTAFVLAHRLVGRPLVDLVADFCRWLPAGTVAAAVGVPYRDMMRLVRGRAAAALAGQCTGQIGVREKALAGFLADVLTDPEQTAALRDAPSDLIARAWAESLRREPPVQIVLRRTRGEIHVSGGVLPSGAPVALLLGAAGRDPERFRHPDRFDPGRADPAQLTYGSGPCPAVTLAALEAEYALRALFSAMPRLRLADGFCPVRAGVVTRAPRSLVVRPGG